MDLATFSPQFSSSFILRVKLQKVVIRANFFFLGTSSQEIHFSGDYIFFLPSGYPQYQPPTFWWVEQLSVPKFEKASIRRKMSAYGDLNSSCHGYLPREFTMFLVKKKLKMKYGSLGSIPNLDLDLL